MRILFATCSAAEAEALVETLLREGLIGCANLIDGVRSRYFWQGRLCREEEVLLIMETTADRAEAATSRLQALHSYDVPKIVVVAAADCSPDYLAWLRETGPPD